MSYVCRLTIRALHLYWRSSENYGLIAGLFATFHYMEKVAELWSGF